MTMTESEICVSYRQAKNKNEQVKILADLNLCKPEDIPELLARNGYITGTPQVKKQEEKKMFRLSHFLTIMYVQKVLVSICST